MLPGTSPDTGTSLRDPLNLAAPLALFMFLIVVLHKTICCLVCKGSDGSRLKRVSFPEENLCVFMGFLLIVTGEVQVNIRLLVSLESEERLKGEYRIPPLQAALRQTGHALSGIS